MCLAASKAGQCDGRGNGHGTKSKSTELPWFGTSSHRKGCFWMEFKRKIGGPGQRRLYNSIILNPRFLWGFGKGPGITFKRTCAFQNCFSLYCSEAQKHPQDKVFGFTIKLLFLRKLIKEDERNENREKVERRTRWDFTVCSPRAVSEALGLSEQEVTVGKDGCCDLGKPRDNSPVTVAACSCPALWPAWTGCTRI